MRRLPVGPEVPAEGLRRETARKIALVGVSRLATTIVAALLSNQNEVLAEPPQPLGRRSPPPCPRRAGLRQAARADDAGLARLAPCRQAAWAAANRFRQCPCARALSAAVLAAGPLRAAPFRCQGLSPRRRRVVRVL